MKIRHQVDRMATVAASYALSDATQNRFSPSMAQANQRTAAEVAPTPVSCASTNRGRIRSVGFTEFSFPKSAVHGNLRTKVRRFDRSQMVFLL